MVGGLKNHIKPALGLGSQTSRELSITDGQQPLSHPQDRLLNAFLGDFDGLHRYLFKQFKTAQEWRVLTYARSSRGKSVQT